MNDKTGTIVWSILCVSFTFLVMQCSRISPKENIEYVNPFICTMGDHGQLHPGATVPFGMVKLGPDTYPSSMTGNGDWAHSGYNYADTLIRGFSHIRRESSGGTAIYDRGWYLSILPSIAVPDTDRSRLAVPIDKRSEKASPGLYQVNLKDAGIEVALTAQTHSGFHQYHFPRTREAHILIEPGSRDFVRSSYINIIGDKEFSGRIDGYQGPMHFWAVLNKPFVSFTTWDIAKHPGVRQLQGKRAGAILDFDNLSGETILLKVGFSLVSEEQARLNLQTEIPDWNFSAIVQKARKSWRGALACIDVDGEQEFKEIFYTALYHSCQQPFNVTDVDGKYLAYDKTIRSAGDFTFYNNYAFWDDYRTKFPLMSLINPEMFTNVFRSIMEIYAQTADYWFYSNPKHEPHVGGFVVCGKDGFTPFLTCRYEHMLTVVLDGFTKGIVKGDVAPAYKGMVRETMVQMPPEYDKIGYIPARPDQTFEYSYDSWCVAQMARLTGNEADYDYFSKRAVFYRNTWDASVGFLRARAADGRWLDFPDDPAVNREKYMYEGTPWQWRWFVPHDVPGMIDLSGGKDKFVQDLDYFFSHSLYQGGNQPDIHAPFLFNYAGAAWLTQKWVHALLTEPMIHRYGAHQFFKEPIRDRLYKNKPDGYLLEMDDDYGCMAAYFVMSAMGLYQLCPGLPVYQLTAPIFNRVTIRLDPNFYPGKQFIIRAENLSRENFYIQSATLNGQPYNKSSITHQEIVRGGELVYIMGPQPNKKWGS